MNEKQAMKEYTSWIVESLMDLCCISPSEAEQLVYRVDFKTTFKNNQEYVYHYSPEYWAVKIYKSNMFQSV